MARCACSCSCWLLVVVARCRACCCLPSSPLLWLLFLLMVFLPLNLISYFCVQSDTTGGGAGKNAPVGVFPLLVALAACWCSCCLLLLLVACLFCLVPCPPAPPKPTVENKRACPAIVLATVPPRAFAYCPWSCSCSGSCLVARWRCLLLCFWLLAVVAVAVAVVFADGVSAFESNILFLCAE